jgi:ABC-type antimicrobial peptide transport system permease subunit
MVLFGTFGVLALLLAAVGLYGVLSYTAQRRTREIGIRVALGAEHQGVVRLVVGRGLRASATGLALGLAASVGATRLMRGILYGVSPQDPITLVGVVAVLVVVAFVACWLPARRATQVDPMVALRCE